MIAIAMLITVGAGGQITVLECPTPLIITSEALFVCQRLKLILRTYLGHLLKCG